MLTALRRRLTLLMTARTAWVLAGALVVTWNYAAAQYRTAAETLLTQNFSAIVDRLDSADSVTLGWLTRSTTAAAFCFCGTTVPRCILRAPRAAPMPAMRLNLC